MPGYIQMEMVMAEQGVLCEPEAMAVEEHRGGGMTGYVAAAADGGRLVLVAALVAMCNVQCECVKRKQTGERWTLMAAGSGAAFPESLLLVAATALSMYCLYRWVGD